MTIYEALKKTLHKNNKTIDDIEFIIVSNESEEEFTIKKEDFLKIAKDHPIEDIESGIAIVGDNFFFTTDEDDKWTDSFGEEDNYLFIRQMPKRPEKEINLVKEMLTRRDALVELGILYDEGADR
jgi:hypothetical protein